jgi:hypothetical protein
VVGTALGDALVNIDNMAVGRVADGDSALMVLATSNPVPSAVQAALRAADGIISVSAITVG